MAYTLLRIVYTIAGGAKENGYNTSQSKPDNEKTILSTPSILSYESVQVKPTFKGGTITKFAQWVEDMMEGSNVSGNVIIEFTVNVYGGVRNVVVKGAGKKTNYCCPLKVSEQRDIHPQCCCNGIADDFSEGKPLS